MYIINILYEIGTKLQWRGKRGRVGWMGGWFWRLLLDCLRKNMAGICQGFGFKIYRMLWKLCHLYD